MKRYRRRNRRRIKRRRSSLSASNWGPVLALVGTVLGVLAAISVALTEMKVDIMGINSQKNSAGKSIINLKVACRNNEHCALIVSRLRGIDGVYDITRGVV